MEHLNYCRQILKQGMSAHVMAAVVASQKFILPPGGMLIEDESLRGIDETMELRLPFPNIALEFQSKVGEGQGNVLFAAEREERIEIYALIKIDNEWHDFETVLSIPKKNYMDRSVSGYLGYPGLVSFDRYDGEERQLDLDDNYSFHRVLLSFLNALSCSNVHVDISSPRKAGKVKSALQFDSYHVLTINVPSSKGIGTATGQHRSPREHVRRGHIRRISDGRRIWVNATVVAAGRGAGTVQKDYAIRST